METENIEKKTITETELNQKIDEGARKAIEEFSNKAIEDKIGELSEALGQKLDSQVKDAMVQIKPDKEVEEAQDKTDEFDSAEEYLNAIIEAKCPNRSRKQDPRLGFVDIHGNVVKVAGHMEIGEDIQGGFLVAEVYRKELKMIALENAIVRPNGATIIPPIKTDSVKIPYVNDTTHASTVFGGVNATWTAEAASKTPTKPTLGQMELTPHKLAGTTFLSHELRADSAIAIVPLLKKMFGSAWGYFEDDAFINGTGAGQPMGILTCGCLKTVFRNTLLRVFFEDIREMYACMLPSSHPFAIWVINPSVLPDLIGMTSGDVAPAAATNPIWINRNMGAENPIPGRIFGRPFFISEKMPALGAQGDIGYFDLRYYLIFDRQPITIDFSSHVNFVEDEDCWRFVLRVAGQCWPQTTLTPRNAGAPVTTISPFVVLDTTTS